MEADLVSRCKLPYTEIRTAGVHGVGLRALPGNLVKLLRGFFDSRRILRDFKPDVLLLTGGYVAVPMAIAGARVKTLLYVPDIEPGVALKALARYADVIALTNEKSKEFFNKNKRMVVTGYPTRSELTIVPREKALQRFDLVADSPVLLVIGGSKGAHTLNQAVFDNLVDLLQQVQVLHSTGQQDWDLAQEKKRSLEASLSCRYHPYPFLYEEISSAFSCASLALSRAGASTLGEFPFYSLPAILVPYPYAWRYQKVNADHLVKQGAAIMIENADLSSKLSTTVSEILADDRKLASMRENMYALAAPDAAARIADLLVEISGKKGEERKTKDDQS
jgi:UDP-N-acetylglucosamine--N-acetylmuramyl-(pentapeptide) pyrophosphoryl-undecaprenol N-acetylglucosamine transferase